MAKDECTQITCFFFILRDCVLILWVHILHVTPWVVLSCIHSYSLVQSRLNFGVDKVFLKFHSICKGRALLPFTPESNGAIELLGDLLGDNESKTDTTSVNFLSTLNKPKEFEQLTLICPLNSQASIFHLDLYIRLAVLFVESVVNGHSSIWLCKLEGVRLDIH